MPLKTQKPNLLEESDMKRIVTARLYALDHADTRHQLSASSAADLATQVQEITRSKQAATLARAAWGDDDADLKVGGVRLVSVGVVVREMWRVLPPLKGQEVVEKSQQPDPDWADLKSLDEAGGIGPAVVASEEGERPQSDALFE